MKLRKYVITLGAATLLAGASIVAFAEWSATGSGTGSAKSLDDVSLTAAASTATACLYPGVGNTCPVSMTVSNPNPYKVNVTHLTVTGVSDSGGCLGTNVTFPVAEQNIADFEVPAAVGGVAGTLPTTVASLVGMDFDAPDACQNKTFDVSVTFRGIQVA